eukprot:jgi/Chlat1/3079/Chrsp21S03330
MVQRWPLLSQLRQVARVAAGFESSTSYAVADNYAAQRRTHLSTACRHATTLANAAINVLHMKPYMLTHEEEEQLRSDSEDLQRAIRKRVKNRVLYWARRVEIPKEDLQVLCAAGLLPESIMAVENFSEETLWSAYTREKLVSRLLPLPDRVPRQYVVEEEGSTYSPDHPSTSDVYAEIRRTAPTTRKPKTPVDFRLLKMSREEESVLLSDTVPEEEKRRLRSKIYKRNWYFANKDEVSKRKQARIAERSALNVLLQSVERESLRAAVQREVAKASPESAFLRMASKDWAQRLHELSEKTEDDFSPKKAVGRPRLYFRTPKEEVAGSLPKRPRGRPPKVKQAVVWVFPERPRTAKPVVPVEEKQEQETTEHPPAPPQHLVPAELPKSRRAYAHAFDIGEVVGLLKKAHAQDVVAINVSDRVDYTEWMVICTGRSPMQLSMMSEALLYKLKQRTQQVIPGLAPGIEGRESNDWKIVDAGSVVVHFFSEDARKYYDLEQLWTAPPGTDSHMLEAILELDDNEAELYAHLWTDYPKPEELREAKAKGTETVRVDRSVQEDTRFMSLAASHA